ncbi:MAG: hypothetical protein ACK4S4_06630 [Pyrinomonadaceae bacterium]
MRAALSTTENSASATRSRTLRNGFYSASAWLVPLALSFVVTPVIVRRMGNDIYGLYGLIVGFINYSFAFGIGRVASKYVAEYRAAGEPHKIKESVSAAFWISIAIAVAGSLLVAIFAGRIVDDVLAIPAAMRAETVTALYLACGAIGVTMAGQVFQYAIQGAHRFDRNLVLTNANAVLLNLGTLGFVVAGFGVAALVGWNLAAATIASLLFYLSAKRLVPGIRIVTRISRESWSGVSKYAASIVVYQIFGNLIVIVERVWITREYGTEAVTFYIVPMLLGIYLHGFVSSLVLALFPVVNELLSERDRLVVIYQKATRLIAAIVVFAAAAAVVGGEMFLSLWLGADFARRSHDVLILHSLSFAVLAMFTLVWQITESFRQAKINSVMMFLWFIITVPMIFLMPVEWGIDGIAAARLAGIAALVPMIFWVEHRFLGKVFVGFWAAAAARLALAGGVAAAVLWLAMRSFPASWLTLIASCAAAGVAYLAVLAAAGYIDADDRRLLRAFAARRS